MAGFAGNTKQGSNGTWSKQEELVEVGQCRHWQVRVQVQSGVDADFVRDLIRLVNDGHQPVERSESPTWFVVGKLLCKKLSESGDRITLSAQHCCSFSSRVSFAQQQDRQTDRMRFPGSCDFHCEDETLKLSPFYQAGSNAVNHPLLTHF